MKTISNNKYSVLYLAILLFAIVLAVVLFIKPRLEKHKGWLGIEVIQDPTVGALVVQRVVPGSPANIVGILPGDKVLSYDGFAVSDVNILSMLVDDSYINQLVRIYIERNGRQLVADTRITDKPSAVQPAAQEIITIPQGIAAPHPYRGICTNCHNIAPPGR